MIGPVGLLPDEAILETGSQIWLGDLLEPLIIIESWFQSIADKLGYLPTTDGEKNIWAAELVCLFEREGWPLSDMASGHIRGYVPSDEGEPPFIAQ